MAAYGGSFEQTLRKDIIPAFENKYGVKVEYVAGNSTDTLEHVRHVMNRAHIRHLPVIDNYSLIGVISIRDISTAFDDKANAAAQSASAA